MALTIDQPLAELDEARQSAAAVDQTDGQTDSRRRKRKLGIEITGAAAESYIDILTRAIRTARLNAVFPPDRPLRTHLSFLAPSANHELYPTVEVARESGLPVARDIFRVKIDRDLAADFLADAASRRLPEEGSRMARRIAYYHDLIDASIMPLSRMRVELRQQIPDENRALFRVTYDRFDIASCLFARYTILLGQRDRFWRKAHVIVDDADLAAPTEAFRRIVGRFTADEAELAFVLLSKLDGIEVEDVRRARVGPLFLPGAKVGGALERLLDREQTPEYDEQPGAEDEDGDGAPGVLPRFILCLPEDRAGVDIAEHASGDPLARLYREAVSDNARAMLDAKADELDYRVSKQRKFVCTPALRQPLSDLCRELGAPSIVRAVR